MNGGELLTLEHVGLALCFLLGWNGAWVAVYYEAPYGTSSLASVLARPVALITAVACWLQLFKGLS